MQPTFIAAGNINISLLTKISYLKLRIAFNYETVVKLQCGHSKTDKGPSEQIHIFEELPAICKLFFVI